MAEFFAGIGLARMALEQVGFQVVWANDIDPAKRAMYARNFDARHFQFGDIRAVRGAEVPDIDLATASFPCTDLSLAGNRRGLCGEQSGLFWEFARVLREMRGRRPRAVLVENVPGFATSRDGNDLRLAIQRLNRLGYWCDPLVVDARWFVPQSRPRLFIVGARETPALGDWDRESTPARPEWLGRFARRYPELRLMSRPLALPAPDERALPDVVERLAEDDERWWSAERQARFVTELAPVQRARLAAMMDRTDWTWATAYRRTRGGKPAWEIRADAISGCLRTARGGSSKQALVEAGRGQARVRWMTAREYARLQGADAYDIANAPEGRALFGFGDAVCVPAVAWLAREYLLPLLSGESVVPRHERAPALVGV